MVRLFTARDATRFPSRAVDLASAGNAPVVPGESLSSNDSTLSEVVAKRVRVRTGLVRR